MQNSRKRKSASRKCCVPSCSNTDLNRHLHTFPQMKEDGTTFRRCLTWVENCGNQSLLKVAPTKLNGRHYVCEDHFDDNQYVCPTKKQRVKKSAVPSLHCPGPLSKSDLSTYVSTFVPEFMAMDGQHQTLASENNMSPCSSLSDPGVNNNNDGKCHDVDTTLKFGIPILDDSSGDFVNPESNLVDEDVFVSVDIAVDEVVFESIPQPNVKVINPRVQRKCSVHGCANYNLIHSMFAFPRPQKIVDGKHVMDETLLKRCYEWIRFSGNRKVLSREISSLHKHFYICGAHFAPDDFSLRGTSMQLKKNAIPTVGGPEPLTDVCIQSHNDHSDGSTNVDGCEPIFQPRDIHMRGVSSTNRLHDLKSERSKKFTKRFEDLMKSFSMVVCHVCKEKYIFYPGLKKAHRGKHLCWKFSSQNNMDPGVVPPQLRDLNFIEEQLIARVHPVLTVVKLKGCQYGYRGNVINFSQDVKEFATQLPHKIDDLASVLTVRFNNNVGKVTDFRVRARKVREALLWLKENNPYYYDIEISSENLEDLPEDGDVFDRISNFCLDDDGEVSVGSDCSKVESESDVSENEDDPEVFKVTSSGVPFANFATQSDHIGAALNWPELNREPLSESTPGFIVCAFPALFPHGTCDLKDVRETEIKMHEYFKHLLSFGDDRFAHHKTFRFFAFNMWMRHTALTSGNVFVNMDNDLSKMNVEQLRERIQQTPSVLKKLMFMGSNIRGSKAYWKSRCGELRDMVEQVGLPTIFLTLSAADLYWPDLFRLLTGKDISEITMRERRILIQENPMVVDMFFQYRLQCFLETVLLPKYEVVDFWYRIEYQHRGSPHVHGLFWLKDAPDVSKFVDGSEEEKRNILHYFDDLVCAVNPQHEPPRSDKHPCESRFEDVVDVEEDLAVMLKTVQRHNCSKGYCERIDKKTKKSYCRFHFPADVCSAAKISVNGDSAELQFTPERNDEKLNKFNPFIISTWRANIDIAPVLSKKAIIEYLSKYVSKSEIGSSTLQEICNSICGSLNSSDKAKKAIHKILMKNCVERDISAQEVCHILMGCKLFCAGNREFVVVYTSSSKWVPLSSNGSNEDDSSNTKRGRSFMEKYATRPSSVHHLSMWDVAKYYNIRTWKKMKKPNVVRVFPRLKLGVSDETNEEFYRQKVLLFVPWTEETKTSLKEAGQLWRDVFDKHGISQMKVGEIEINVTASSDDPQVEEDNTTNGDVMDEDWMIASRLSGARRGEEVELGRRGVDVEYDWHAHSRDYDSYGDLKYFKSFIESEKKKDHSSFTFNDELPDITFSEEQEAVKGMMERQVKHLQTEDACDVPRRVLVQGKAGTGKSLLIRYLVAKLRREFGSDSFLLLGPTGVSAININGATIHSVLKIPRTTKSFQPLKGETAKKFCDMMEKVKFVIIDEYSMMGCSLLGMIDKRFREGTGVNEPFGNLCVYFFGDYRQLPPVKDVPLYGGVCRHDLAQHGKNIFNSFESHFVLTKGHRQKDVKFQELLDRLSVGEVTPEDYNVLKQRFVTNVNRQVQNSFENVIRLFSTKEEVANYNNLKLHTLMDADGNLCPVARVPANHNGRSASSGSADQADGLHSVLYLARGSQIMLRSNLWVQKGLVNGSTGIIKDLLYEAGKEPLRDAPAILMCKFDNYRGPGIGPDNLVPISPVVRSWTSVTGSQCSRQQFPIVVCYACSIHKSQGLTLEKAFIDIGPKEFALGLCYVGLSRVKSLDGLLLKPFTYQRLQLIKTKPEMALRRSFERTVFAH